MLDKIPKNLVMYNTKWGPKSVVKADGTRTED